MKLKNEKWYSYNYLIHLRYVEFYLNCKLKNNKFKFLSYIPFLYHWFRYKRIGFMMRYYIAPNTIGPGVRIFHAGDMVGVGKECRIGANCSLRPGVVFCRKSIKPEPDPAVVGDNCEFGWGGKKCREN